MYYEKCSHTHTHLSQHFIVGLCGITIVDSLIGSETNTFLHCLAPSLHPSVQSRATNWCIRGSRSKNDHSILRTELGFLYFQYSFLIRIIGQ